MKKDSSLLQTKETLFLHVNTGECFFFHVSQKALVESTDLDRCGKCRPESTGPCDEVGLARQGIVRSVGRHRGGRPAGRWSDHGEGKATIQFRLLLQRVVAVEEKEKSVSEKRFQKGGWTT